MAKRPLPLSEVLSSTSKDGPLPNRGKFATSQAKPTGNASELNAQRARPVYDEFRKRRDYDMGEKD